MPWYEWDACLRGDWRLYTFLCRDSRFTRRWRSMKRRMDFTRGYAEFLKIKRGWTKLRLPESNETVGQRGDIVFVGTSYSQRPPQRAATMERLPSARRPHSIRPFDELHDKSRDDLRPLCRHRAGGQNFHAQSRPESGALPLSAFFRISIMAAGVIIRVDLCCFRERSSLSPVTRNSAWLASASASR
jgi:hypothetical protein